MQFVNFNYLDIAMQLIKSISFTIIVVFCAAISVAQPNIIADSLQSVLLKTAEPEAKCKILERLTTHYAAHDPAKAEQFGKEYIVVAETSRDRKLIASAYLTNGFRLSRGGLDQAQIDRALAYFKKAEDIATQHNLPTIAIKTIVKRAEMQLLLLNYNAAAEDASKAASKMSSLKNDSILIVVQNLQGNVLLAKNQKIEALRTFLNSLYLAKEIKSDQHIRSTYKELAKFYTSIEDYDKALDYQMLAFNKISTNKNDTNAIQKANDLREMGDIYLAKKDFPLAIELYERSIALADSIKFENLLIRPYVGMLNVYLLMKEPAKSLAFLNSAKGEALKTYFRKFNYGAYLDQGKAIIFSEMGLIDSARIYFNAAEPFFKNTPNKVARISNLLQYAYFLRKAGNNKEAIQFFQQVQQSGKEIGQLELELEAAKQLDTLYGLSGNVEASRANAILYFQLKDSIQNLNKQKELTQLEANDEQKRQEDLATAAAEKKRQRNNLQYMSITIGITSIFILLILFGMFKVSARTIRILAFFAFLMFFEFIFLLFKKNIYAITKGEPWLDLAFMILLAAILLPLHHWVEHKMIHFLTSQNKLTNAGLALRSRFKNIKQN